MMSVKYNRGSYLWAKQYLVPNLVQAEKLNGTVFNVPETLQTVSHLLLGELDDFTKGEGYDIYRKYAFHVMSTFQMQLTSLGYYEYGDSDIRELLPQRILDEMNSGE
jgi:hypothetical protein